MKNLTKNETASFLRGHDFFCILTHRKPDGDTIGSAAALCRGLRAMGKQAWILNNVEVTERYIPLLEGLTCEECAENMTVVTVDVAAENMLASGFERLLPRIELKIDHHGTGSGYAAAGFVDGSIAACGEMVYELLLELGVEMDEKIAEAVYVAVSTDTGCFRYSNTTANTLRTAAACLEAGIDSYSINQEYFETRRLSRLKLDAYMVQHMELYREGQIALCLIPAQAEQEMGVVEDDTQNLANFVRNVEGVKMAVTFREDKSGGTKLSVRSAPGYDSAALCAALGGGGHVAAAGARVNATLEETREKVLTILQDQGYL